MTSRGDERRYVSVVEAAKMLGLSETVVRRMIRAGTIPYFRSSPRGVYRIPLDRDGRPVVTQ